MDSHSTPQRANSEKTNRQKAAKSNLRTTKKNKMMPLLSAAPQWALEAIFKQAHVIAWEGTAKPIKAHSIYPATGSFLDAISFSRKGNVIKCEESIHPLDKARTLKAFSDIKQFPFEIEYRLVTATGAFAWVRHFISEKICSGRATLLRGFVHDIQTEKELELESLQVSEREQNRIGQDLHDDLCQVLAGVSCLLRVAEGRLAVKMPEEVANLSELNLQVVEAMKRTRALTHGLFPGKIQVADARGALLELVSQVRARFQVEVKTTFTGRFPQHSANQTIQIYRLAQEAISNAIKHGQATCIEIQLKAKPTTMLLSIIDNGTGMSQSESDEKGVGLHIMQYRANTLGGELDIRNASKQGVIVTFEYPFQP